MLWRLLLLCIPCLVLRHLWTSPFTKVEESFNVQAIHDILLYGLPTQNVYFKLKAQYDHMTFSGAVPRTFIGALVLSALSKPFVVYGQLNLEQQQFLIRAVLGLLNGTALCMYAFAVKKAFGRTTALWYLFLQCSQFHVIYYASRPLPNMFAFTISTIALCFTLPNPNASMAPIKRTRLALYLLTLVTIIFRSELALLLGAYALHLLVRSPTMATRIAMMRTILLPPILSGTVAGLILTVSIDTYFWQSNTLLWPELAAFLSNIFPKGDGQGASAWGTSPWHWYFTSALPRLMMNPVLLLLIPYGMTTTLRQPLFDLLFPSVTYTALYSILPHKETRFLFPIVPTIITSVALVAAYISTRRTRYLLYNIATIVLVLSTFATFVFSQILLGLSAQTYPGAHALQSVHALSTTYSPKAHINVHLTNLALQTGITRFLERPPPKSPLVILPGSSDGKYPTITTGGTHWHYDKSDNASEFRNKIFWDQFDYVIIEKPAQAIGQWDVVDKILGLGKPHIIDPDTARGYLVLGPQETEEQLRERRRKRMMGKRVIEDPTKRLIETVAGAWARRFYEIVHDVMREGYGVRHFMGRDWSWTRGWWFRWGLETKLYVLKKREHYY